MTAPTGNQTVRQPMMVLSATKLYIILWLALPATKLYFILRLALYACVSDGRVDQRVPGVVYNDII